jgi:hypothetical protein
MAAGGGDSGGDTEQPRVLASTAKELFESMNDKVSGTDPSTGVSATVAMQTKDWGTSLGLELKGVKGELKCSLIAVTDNGERWTASTWSVGKWGYGLPDGKTPESKKPLYIGGAVAPAQNDIDHFEVVTSDGKKLVEIDA